jgi:hypothetical protein
MQLFVAAMMASVSEEVAAKDREIASMPAHNAELAVQAGSERPRGRKALFRREKKQAAADETVEPVMRPHPKPRIGLSGNAAFASRRTGACLGSCA